MKWYLKVLRQYADFSGRASRKEFWMFVLFNIIFLFVAAILDVVLGQNLGYAPNPIFYTLYLLATLIPALAVMVRRLHDINKSGWMILIGLIPIAGQIWLLILFIKEGEMEDMDSITFEPVNVEAVNASMRELKCPHCGKDDLTVLGIKGALGKSIATTLAFGAIGNIVAGKNAAKNTETEPMQYKCNSCKQKFSSEPLQASPEEILSAPCTINFKRTSSVVGAAVPYIVYLNGIKIGAVKKGQAISFQTNVKYNTLFVTDHHGVAFKNGNYKFEAQPGASVYALFDRKFLETKKETLQPSAPPSKSDSEKATENLKILSTDSVSSGNHQRRIAHLKMTCPHCGKYTSVYVEENGASSAKVKCEHCKEIFEFGAGMMYEPVAYVSQIPKWAVIDAADAQKKVYMSAIKCKKCGKTYDNADVELESTFGKREFTLLDPSNPSFRKLLGLKTLLKCSNCSAIVCSDCALEADGIIGMRCPFCNVDYTIYSFIKPTV
ncbi:MAG: DUF805 domain-containing protein [Tannerella sp.]|jgi:uncharacterized membrane protein YhaH (DUF805 family)/transcription elongation factor Elf1|nr:DUF805 domain-containing protein [Tannerella sp.]